jgi:hypothetical protein
MNGRTERIGIVAALLVFLVLALWVGPVPTDELFVSHSYARHVAAGDGLVFNAGESPTEGYASLLWVLICAVPGAAGLDIPSAAAYVALFFGALCVLILADLLRRRAAKTAFWLTTLFVFATSAPLVMASMTGSDASLFSALLLACVWLMDRMDERPSAWTAAALGVVVSLALLCRFEAVIVAVIAVVALLRNYRRDPRSHRHALGAVAFVALVGVAYHGWRVVTFGHLVPDSLVLRAGLNTGVFEGVLPYDIPPFGLYYLVVAIITAVALRAATTTPAERFGVTVALLLGITYVFIKDPTPALSNHAALMGVAVVTWPRAHLALMGRSAESAPGPSRLAHILLILSFLMLAGRPLPDNRATVGLMRESDQEALRPLGEWLAAWRPGAVLATNRPGIVSYYADCKTLDLREHSRLGSTDPDREHALIAVRPDVILLTARGGENPVVDPDAARFERTVLENYRTAAIMRTAWRNDRSIAVNIRRDIPPLSEAERTTFPKGLSVLYLPEDD